MILNLIFCGMYVLCIFIIIIKVRYIRKAKQKVIIYKFNKKRAVVLGITYSLLVTVCVFTWLIWGFDIDDVHTLILPLFYLEISFIGITPDGTVGDAIKNNGITPKENYRYRYTFKGAFQTECLEIYHKNMKKPEIYYGNIKNPELIKMLEENYSEYVDEDST